MNNILIIITGWIVLLSIAVYIVTLFIKEFVAMVRSEATLYKRTKLFRTRIKARKNEAVAMALRILINDYWNVKKTHPDCNTWSIGQWHDYYVKQNESKKY